MVIMMVVGSLYNMVDQIFIGQGVGLLGNAATNVAFPITTVVLAISVMLGIGGILVAGPVSDFIVIVASFLCVAAEFKRMDQQIMERDAGDREPSPVSSE